MKISEILIKMACLVSDIFTKILKGILEGLATLSIIVFFLSKILKIWVDESMFVFLDKMFLTSIWVFIFSFLFYGFLFFELKPKKRTKNNEIG